MIYKWKNLADASWKLQWSCVCSPSTGEKLMQYDALMLYQFLLTSCVMPLNHVKERDAAACVSDLGFVAHLCWRLHFMLFVHLTPAPPLLVLGWQTDRVALHVSLLCCLCDMKIKPWNIWERTNTAESLSLCHTQCLVQQTGVSAVCYN